ncbi:uncharacterized protein LOC111392849 [Olea europaea var. sylvestris]|nr:uncharacterized protein LOC111392849 [Olea europaea var. sylvestris]XP_022874011.1 uncharacterized protein LOC111392849 [Olea europaea var. sylvestris]CAA2961385.1 ycf49 isoform X1 [Olea europaea subsp. europaea]
MGILALFSSPKPIFLHKSRQTHLSSPKFHAFAPKETIARPNFFSTFQNSRTIAVLFGAAGIALTTLVEPAAAAEAPLFNEPANALSLPTWAIHVSSVVEWITAMALVWQYGEKSGFESWKGLSWGMVPLLGGAFCACTWHFFYNSEALEVLVAIQAALTVIGNATMCIAAFRIYTISQERSKNL